MIETAETRLQPQKMRFSLISKLAKLGNAAMNGTRREHKNDQTLPQQQSGVSTHEEVRKKGKEGKMPWKKGRNEGTIDPRSFYSFTGN
jgi:hypothetical protein